MEDESILKSRLEKLNNEHTELDHLIAHMLGERIVNQIAVQRLKKQKLLLRDQILLINSKLLPNIIA
jgi:hypothetical protein